MGGGFGVEDVLPIVHVEDGVMAVGVGVIAGREPDFDLAGVNVLGGEGGVDLDGHGGW